MSQEPEDVKPKLNLNITYEGNRKSSPTLEASIFALRSDAIHRDNSQGRALP